MHGFGHSGCDARRPLAAVLSAAIAFGCMSFTFISGAQELPPRRPSLSNSPKPIPTGNAQLSGTVIDSASGTPVAGAEISLVLVDAGFRGSDLTDSGGRYRISNVPPGVYHATARKVGFIPTAYGQRGAVGSGQSLTIAAGEARTDVDFRLERAAVVSGRILDWNGDPVLGASVQLLRRGYASGWRLSPIGRATTNDLGEYRIPNITPGSYYVLARPRTGAPTVSSSAGVFGYASTYYPGSVTPTPASRLAIRAGQTVVADLSLERVPFSSIKGVAVDSLGRPLRGRSVSVSDAVTGGGVGATPIDEDGNFRTPLLPPGLYGLSVSVNQGRGGRQAGPAESERAFSEVSLNGADLDGVRLMARPLFEVKGTIVASPGDNLKSLLVPSLTVFPVPRSVLEERPRPAITSGSAFSFSLSLHEGEYWFEVRSLPVGWAVDSIRLGGVDITDGGGRFSATMRADLQIAVTRQYGQVGGNVRQLNGAPASGAVVLVFPQASNLWQYPHRYVFARRVGENGGFDVSGVPPGEYLVGAFSGLDDPEVGHPEDLEQARARASRITIRKNERVAIDLRPTALR